MTFTPETLRSIGLTLYGPHWQSQLARDLGVAVRTCQRWASGEFNIPEGIKGELAIICAKRGGELEKWARELGT